MTLQSSCDATRFTWHQPRELVKWEFQITDVAGTWEQAPIKPLEMKKSNFADAKELIRFALGRLKRNKAATN